MKLSHRITLLCTSAAAGLGLAIGTALTLDPASGPIPAVAVEQVARSEGPAGPAHAASREVEASPAVKPEIPRVADSPARQPDAPASNRVSRADRALPIEPPAVDRREEGLFRSVRVAVGTEGRPAPKNVGPRSDRNCSLSEGHREATAAPAATEQATPLPDSIATRAYRPQNLTPAELQQLVEPLLTDGVGTAAVSPSIEVGSRSPGREGAGVGTGTVVVVRDHPAVLDQIDRVVAQIDVRPPQVRIQAIVLTVRLKDADPQGVDFDFLRQRKHLRSQPASASDAAPGLPAAMVAEPSGLKCGVLEGSVASLLDTLDTVGPTRLAAVPAMTSGEGNAVEIPLAAAAGGEGAAGKGAIQPDSPDSPRDRLLLRPLSSVEGSIRLEIKIPSSGDDLVPAGTGPSSAGKDSLATTLVVPDAATVVLGGIVRRAPKTVEKKVPMSDRLPTLPRSARTSGEKAWSYETLVLLNPHVVDETEQGREQAAESLPPEVCRSIARRYFLAARQALAGRDPQQALRLLEAALRFDPLDSRAVEARNRLWLSGTTGADGPASQRLAARPVGDRQAGRLP